MAASMLQELPTDLKIVIAKLVQSDSETLHVLRHKTANSLSVHAYHSLLHRPYSVHCWWYFPDFQLGNRDTESLQLLLSTPPRAPSCPNTICMPDRVGNSQPFESENQQILNTMLYQASYSKKWNTIVKFLWCIVAVLNWMQVSYAHINQNSW